MSRKLAILQSLIARWSDGDIDGVLEHLSEDIVWHYAAGAAPPLRGKTKARRFMENYKAQINRVRWRLFDFAEAGNRLFVEGVDEVHQADGMILVGPYAGVLDFDGDLIAGWRDYVDTALLDAQRNGGVTPDWVTALADRTALS